MNAQGRPAVTKAANEFFKAGHTPPEEQDVYLQLLEHADEARVCEALTALARVLLAELPKRRAVLESRLRRIEELAEDAATRTAAADLRRQVTGRAIAPSAKIGGPAILRRSPGRAESAKDGDGAEGEMTTQDEPAETT